MYFTFTVDSSALALDWLDHNRELWSDAYSIHIEPLGYPNHPITGETYRHAVTIITVQGENLTIPADAVVGHDQVTGFRQGLLYVSDELAVAWCDTADRAEEASS